MTFLPTDPLDGISISKFAERFRRGETSSEATTTAYLKRITALDPKIGAFVYVNGDQALATAQAMDRLLAAGTDLGPLMGIPVSLKDLFTVDGMPVTVGSKMDISDLVEPEGSLVKTLKSAGCIILGKTKQTELSLAINLKHSAPWNPCDPHTKRISGASSNGSAVALAAGLSAFTIGSDAGGSVRQPASLNGVFGYKATTSYLPTDGGFPLSTTMDSIGIFANSARDAATILGALTDRGPPETQTVKGLRLGKPANHFFEDLHPMVEACVDKALAALEQAGVELVPFNIPEVAEIDSVSAEMVPAELIATLGRDRFLQQKGLIDPVAFERASGGIDMLATDYIRMLRRHHRLIDIARERMIGLDGWITPTTPLPPLPVADFATKESAAQWNLKINVNGRPGNLFGQCGVSIPIHMFDTSLPVGLQILCPPDHDRRLLSIARGIEELLGRPPKPDVAKFL